MPLITDAAANAMVDAVLGLVTHTSLHTDWSASGGNEVAGGSPAYARQPTAWDAAAGRAGDNTNAEQFDVPAGTTIRWVGFWSALNAGTFYGMLPLGSQNYSAVAAVSAGDDRVESPGHGLADDDLVVFLATDGNAMPGGLTEGQPYFVINATTDDYQVSATQGGAAVAISSSAEVFAAQMIPETFGSQGTFAVPAGGLSLLAY